MGFQGCSSIRWFLRAYWAWSKAHWIHWKHPIDSEWLWTSSSLLCSTFCARCSWKMHHYNTISEQKSILTNIPWVLVEREHRHSQRRLKSPSNCYSWMLFAAFISALSTEYMSQLHMHLQHLVMLINRAVKGFLMHLCQGLHGRSYSEPGEPLW